MPAIYYCEYCNEPIKDTETEATDYCGEPMVFITTLHTHYRFQLFYHKECWDYLRNQRGKRRLHIVNRKFDISKHRRDA